MSCVDRAYINARPELRELKINAAQMLTYIGKLLFDLIDQNLIVMINALMPTKIRRTAYLSSAHGLLIILATGLCKCNVTLGWPISTYKERENWFGPDPTPDRSIQCRVCVGWGGKSAGLPIVPRLASICHPSGPSKTANLE